MIKILIGLLVCFFLFAPAYAQSTVKEFDVSYDIRPDGTVLQTLTFVFDQPVNDQINYTISEQIKDLMVFGKESNPSYKLQRMGNNYVVTINPNGPLSTMIIEYTVINAVFRSSDVYHFFSELDLEDQVDNVIVNIKLPLWHTVYNQDYLPADMKFVSDGERIIAIWEKSGNETQVLFSIKFYNPNNPMGIGAVLLIFFTIAIMLVYNYYKKKASEAFFKGFHEDEIKAIKYIKSRQAILQKDLEMEFKFSRSKSTRITHRLEQNGLIKKQRHGRTNKITWVGK